MSENYTKKGVEKPQYTQRNLILAMMCIEDGLSIREAGARFHVPYTILRNKSKGLVIREGDSVKDTSLLPFEERDIAQHLVLLREYGVTIDNNDLRRYVKLYLNSRNRIVCSFKGNHPGIEWVYGFLDRNKDVFTHEKYSNINGGQTDFIGVEEVVEYFNRLQKSLKGVKAEHIVNYEEISLSDDPENGRYLFRKEMQDLEMDDNSSKTLISVMFTATASGSMLPPYVVYKGDKLEDSQIEHGPEKCKYNCSRTGAFDFTLFVDYVKSIVIPYFRREPKDTIKVLIGDNIMTYLSVEVVEICEENNIKMVFLPSNYTRFLQPLDAAVFHSMEVNWERILNRFKDGAGKILTASPGAGKILTALPDAEKILNASPDAGKILTALPDAGKVLTASPKDYFPPLLLKLLNELQFSWKDDAQSGFRKCGISPLNMDIALSAIRQDAIKQKEDLSIDSGFVQLKNTGSHIREELEKDRSPLIEETLSGLSVENEDFIIMSEVGEDYDLDVEEDDRFGTSEEETQLGTSSSEGVGTPVGIHGMEGRPRTPTGDDRAQGHPRTLSGDDGGAEGRRGTEGRGEPRLRCPDCSYKTSLSARMREHSRTHTGARPLSCPTCPYKAATKCTLKRHMAVHLGGQGRAKPFPCPYCPYAATDRRRLSRHLRTHTRERPYECGTCPHRSTSKVGLEGHEKMHTREKPYECGTCPHRSASKVGLVRHERAHSGEKPYKCAHCPHRASRWSNLVRHEKTHKGRERDFKTGAHDDRAKRVKRSPSRVKDDFTRHCANHKGEKVTLEGQG